MKVVLIGNYAPDAQESMLRYAEMIRGALIDAGHQVALVSPRTVINRQRRTGRAWKWAGYIDKYLLGTDDFRRAAQHADLVHVCDHSNAVYVPRASAVPYVVTCHDLLAVRGALGEQTDCPASPLGRQLQKAILAGLGRAHGVACVSEATLRDARRLLQGFRGRLALASLAPHHPFGRIAPETTANRLRAIPGLAEGAPYVLHVGSNLRRKNRPVVLAAVAGIAALWPGHIVFAGEPPDSALREQAAQLGVADRVIEVPGPDNDLLEALYNGALALLFPSRFEGFGWPVIEAQACGCAVICSDREPLPEIGGGAAIFCAADAADAFGRAILELHSVPGRRAQLAAAGEANARRYTRATLARELTALYGQVAGHA